MSSVKWRPWCLTSMIWMFCFLCALNWLHNWRDSVSNRQPRHCLPNRLFRRRSKKTPKLRVTGLCEGNSPVTGEFPSQRASYAENNSIWWHHHTNWSRINEYSAFSRSFVNFCKLQSNFFITRTFSKIKSSKRLSLSPPRGRRMEYIFFS